MQLANEEVLYITATEIQNVRTGSQYLRMPVIDETTCDATVQQVNLDGYTFTGLVTYNITGDAALIIDMKTGITFELMKVLPDAVDSMSIVTLAEKKELDRLINLPSAG